MDQGETLKNETTYIDNEDISLLSSTVIPENTVQERTKINSSENSLTRKSMTHNHYSDGNSTDNKQIRLFDGSNIPLSHFIEGCCEAKAMAANTRSTRKFSVIIEK